jgi:flagellar motor switch protein FliG
MKAEAATSTGLAKGGAAPQGALTGPQKCLLFLISLEEAAATRILGQFNDDELKQLRKASMELAEADPKHIAKVHQEFSERAETGAPASLKGSGSYLRRLAGKALGEGRVAELWTDRPESQGPLADLARADAKMLLGMLENEHPQTVAVILAQLEPGRAGDLLQKMTAERQAEVVLRMARLEVLDPTVIADIEREFASEAEELLQATTGKKVGGIDAAAGLVKRLDAEASERLLEQLNGADAETAESLKRALFTFEDLVRVDGRGMQVLLKEIPTDQIVTALKSASDDIKEKVFGNVSTRAAAMLRDELEMLGPVRVSDVEAAQRAIVETAMALERDRRITIAREGGGDYV